MNVKRGYLDFSDDICMRWNSSDGLENYLLEDEDILIQMDGALIGKSYAKIAKEQLPALLVQRVTRARAKAKIACADFMYQTIQRNFLKYIGINKTETAVPHLSLNDIKNFEIMVPSLEEQQKIGAYFSNLDHLITLHQRECISFTGRADRLILTANKKRTTSSWEQRKFEEIAVRSSVICSDDTLPRVEYEDIVSGAGRLNKDIYAKQSIKSGIAFHQGDVLYGKLRPYLQNWLLPTFDGLAVGDFWVLQPQNADSSFLYRLIQSRQFDEVANQSTGTKMPRADWKLVSKTVFSIPSNISEQAAIGTYFTALDSLITLHQRKPFLMKWRTSDANRNQTNRLVL